MHRPLRGETFFNEAVTCISHLPHMFSDPVSYGSVCEHEDGSFEARANLSYAFSSTGVWPLTGYATLGGAKLGIRLHDGS